MSADFQLVRGALWAGVQHRSPAERGEIMAALARLASASSDCRQAVAPTGNAVGFAVAVASASSAGES